MASAPRTDNGSSWSTTPSQESLGSLARLPFELRSIIYSYLLVSHTRARATWGRGSGISTSILATSSAVHHEAIPHLYQPHHIVCCLHNTVQHLPPRGALLRMHRLTIELCYCTINRGDCEQYVKRPQLQWLCAMSDFIALTLRHNDVLQELYVCLLNEGQRKRGPKRIRSQSVRQDVERILRPFAMLRRSVPVLEITGFDTLEFAEMFDEMRERLAGTEIPIEQMLMQL